MAKGVAAIVSAIWLGCGLVGPVLAQEPAASDAAPAGAAAPQLGRERIMVEVLGFEPVGEPVVSPAAGRGEAVLTVPLRLKEEGRLAADIATDAYRMAAGAPVVHREFKPRNTDQAEAVQAWCGPGEQRGMFGWAGGITVCMIHTADGKATLGVPQLFFGSWWMTSTVSLASADARTERVAVETPETPSTFTLVIDFDRLRTDGVSVRAAIEGPGMSIGGRPYRYNMQRQTLPLTDGAARLVHDGLQLRLTPRGNPEGVTIAAERTAPPLDFAALRARVAAANPDLANAVSEAAAEAEDELEPTPFVIGGVKLDPAALTVGEGVLGRGGVVLSGQAEYAVTGRLAKPLNLRAPLINDTAPEGLILHQLEFARTSPVGARTMTRIWCGPIGVPTVWSRNRVTMCLRRGLTGELEAFWPSTGRPWLGTTQATGSVAALQARGFEIAPSPTSLLDPLGFRAEIQRLSETVVTVRFIARKGTEDAVVLAVTTEFEDGVATLPLWTHRLILTRSGAGVTAALTADGDGSSPTEGGFYP